MERACSEQCVLFKLFFIVLVCEKLAIIKSHISWRLACLHAQRVFTQSGSTILSRRRQTSFKSKNILHTSTLCASTKLWNREPARTTWFSKHLVERGTIYAQMHSQPAPHQTHCLHFILMGWTVEEILCTSYKSYATIKHGDTLIYVNYFLLN